MIDHTFLVIDLFCGAGGTTTGFEMTGGVAKVIAAVNHDPKAIKSHWVNHPDVQHFEEDIRHLDLDKLVACAAIWQEKYPDAKLILWASLECTNFSKAKGGLPRDADSRTLATDLIPYIDALQPDYVLIENVEEFMSWGPLDENGKPLSRHAGIDYLRWVGRVTDRGYVYDWRLLNSADFGAYTSRKRYFGIFAAKGMQIVFPQPTHAKNPKPGGMFETLQSWKPVRDVLDFSDEGTSIFDRKKPLSDKTLSRIYAGLLKYVANGKESMLIKWRSHKGNNFSGSVADVNDPCPTVTTMNHLGVARCFLQSYYGNGQPHDTESPCPTVPTKDRFGMVSAHWLDTQFSSGQKCRSVDRPTGSLLTVPKLNLCSVCWLDKQYGGSERNHQSIDDPAGSLTANPPFAFMTANFIMPTSYTNKPKGIDEPCPTILANRKYHYLVNPQYSNTGNNVEKPCFTLIARMDKKPPYLVTTESGELMIQIFEEDTEIMIKIKEFMSVHGIINIKMRMLKVLELLKIQGFPENYKLLGNQTDQKKFIGNSVVPHVVKAWAEKLAITLKERT